MASDRECDILVIGMGGAGAAASIVAHDLGASVIAVEKNADPGGNTKYSGGTMRVYGDHRQAADYIEAVCEGATPRAVIEAFVAESSKNQDWISSLGGEVVRWSREHSVKFPTVVTGAALANVAGADGLSGRSRVGGKGAGGINLWGVLWRNISERGIDVMLDTPAKNLLTDVDGAVRGALVESGGAELRIWARKGVILASGGFEYSHPMHIDYFGTVLYGLCNPGNTGDGIRMAQDVGADLWHMSAVACGLGYRLPDVVPAVSHQMLRAGFIYVDQQGRRFMNETGVDAHNFWGELTFVDARTNTRPRYPAWVIFDDDTRLAGPVAITGRGKISDSYQWSDDNAAEIERGWIKKADTIDQLAQAMGIRADTVQQTVADFNLACIVGYDRSYDRAIDTLIPLVQPPFHAIEVWPTIYNTQGGPRRNERAQVLRPSGRPIARLYSAGELGSLWHRYYPGGGNVSEALAFGRIAARNAVAEEPWPEQPPLSR